MLQFFFSVMHISYQKFKGESQFITFVHIFTMSVALPSILNFELLWYHFSSTCEIYFSTYFSAGILAINYFSFPPTENVPFSSLFQKIINIIFLLFFNSLNFILFLNFTLLYWFCQISK